METNNTKPISEKPKVKPIRNLLQVNEHSYINISKVIAITANEFENEIVFTFENGIKHIEHYENFNAIYWLEKIM